MAVPLRVGRQVRLRNEFAGSFMSMEGFCDGNARKARFRLLENETCSPDEVPHVPTDQMFQIVAVGDHPSQILFTGSWNPAVAALRGKGRVDLDLQKIAAAPRLLASKLETLNLRDVTTDELKDMMSKMLASDSRISGVAAAFEPGRMNPEVDYFAQYVGRDLSDPASFRYAELTPQKGYLPLYREWDWYRFPKSNDSSYWADPYLDAGGGNVPMISYSVPVRQNGQFVGVVKMDIEMDIDSSPALTKPIEANSEEVAEEEGGDAEKIKRANLELVLEALSVGPNSAAAKMAIVPVVDEEVVKTTLTEMLSGQFKNLLGACLAFERGQSKIPGTGQRYALYARKEKVTGDISFAPLLQNDAYWESSWFRDAINAGSGQWGPIVDDLERKGEKIISFSIPFSVKGGNKYCGVIRLDVQYDGQLKNQVDNVGKNKTVYCTACDLEVPLCYFTNSVTLNKICICLRDFVDGIVSWGTTENEYVKVETRAYQEYAEQYRKSRDIVFGQVIQLVHSKVGRFLSVTLKDQEGVDPNAGSRQFYQVELENDLLLSDPYLEGTENSWFTILPASDAKSLGERVMEGDQCRLMSTRWQWEVQFPQTEADNIMDLQPKATSPRSSSNEQKNYVLSSPLHWKLMACGETDEQIYNRIKQKKLTKASQDLLAIEESKHASANAAGKDEAILKSSSPNQNLDFGLLQPPPTLSQFVRNWDLIYLRRSTTSDCLAVSANFHPKGSDNVKVDPESKFVYYGRYSYNLEVHQENRGTAVWRIEVPTANDPDVRAVRSRGEYDDTCTAITWGMTVRLRHLASQRFLCLSTKSVKNVNQSGPIGQFIASTCGPERVLDDDFRLTSHDQTDFESDEHVLCRLVPVAGDAEADDVITVNTPFYIQLLPNPRANKNMANEYWMNLAGSSATFTSYRDEDDVFSIKKGTLTEQKAVYQSREYFKNIDSGISYLYESWDKYPRPPEDKKSKPDSPKEWVNAFVTDRRTVDNFNAMSQFIKFCQNNVIMAGNSATADPEGMLNDPRNYERESNTGFCLRFRQELALRANVLGRVFSILTHPLFTELVKFPSGRMATEEEEEEAEMKDIVAGLSDKKKKAGGISAAEEKAAELEEGRKKCRELALDCFRECCRFGALLMVDFPDAAIELARIQSNLDFLVRMVYPSAQHGLGVALWLSLIFENGRDRKASLSLTTEHLNECMRTWDMILRKRARLQRQREKALTRRFSPSVWRGISSRDEDLYKTQETFIRFLCATCHASGAADSLSQRRLLDSFVARAKAYRLGADGQPIFENDTSSSDKNSVASFVSANGRDNATANDDEKALQSKIPRPLETAPLALRLLAGIVLGASRTAGHGIMTVVKDLIAVTGLHDLDLSFSALVKRSRDASLSLAVRHRYCSMLHRLYFDRMYPRRLVNYTPFTAGSGKDQKLINPSQFLAQQTQDRARRVSTFDASLINVFKIGTPEVSVAWGFILEYLAQCGPHSEMNDMTLAVLAMTRSLVELDFEDIDEESKDNDVGLFGIGPGSRLSELATQLFTVLKTKQHNDRGLNAIQWIVEQLKFRDIKIEICKLFNTLFDYRLNQQMSTFFSLRASGIDGLIVEPGDENLRFEGQFNKNDIPLLELNEKKSDDWLKTHIPGFGTREHNNVETAVFSERNKLFSSDFLRLEPALIQVVEAWDDLGLVMSCFGLILRQYSQRQSIMKALRRCRFLTSTDDLARAQKLLFDKVDLAYLLKIELECVEWTEIDVPVLVAKTPQVLSLLRSIAGQFVDENQIPTDLKPFMFERDHSDVSVPGVVGATVVQPSAFCSNAQHIFRLFGLHRLLIDVLHIPLPPNCKALRDVYMLVYNILSLWSHKNPQNVKKLERHVPFFFSQGPFGAGPTMLLTAITHNNYDVACRIPAQSLEDYMQYLGLPVAPTADQIQRFSLGRSPVNWWTYTSSFDHSWKRSALSLELLKGIVRCSGRLVKSNQVLIVKAICENVYILGLFAELEDDAKFQQFVGILNFTLPSTVQNFQLGKVMGKDLNVAGMTIHNLPNAEEKSRGQLTSKEAMDAQQTLTQKQYYLELMSCLTRCSPCKYVYEQDRAKRESEESSLLCRAAMPMKSLINVLVSLTDAAAKIPVLRLFEQVYSGEMNALNNRSKMRLLRNLSVSVEEVAKHLEVTLGGTAGKSSTSPRFAPSRPISNFDYIYVFEVVLPFFVGFYHSSFRVSSATRDEVELSQDLFDNLVSLTRYALEYRQRDGDEAALAISGTHKSVSSTRESFSMDAISSRIMLGGFSLDNALNCLMHMADPTGSGLFRDTVEGVMGTQNQAEFVAFFKKLQGTVQLEQDKSTATEAVEIKNKKVETSMERWVRHNKNAFVSGARKELNELFAFIAEHNTNRVVLRKIILLVGEFGQENDVLIGHRSFGNDWVDENASRFCVAYLQALQHLVDIDEDESTRELLIELGVCRILMKLISRSSSLRVKKAAFSLSNAMLSSGLNSQDAFERTYLSEGSNLFFIRLRDLMATPLGIRTKQEVKTYGVGQTPERFGSWPLMATMLRFTQALCEGHNLNWQMLLSHQNLVGSGDEIAAGTQIQVGISVNVVTELCDFLGRLVYSHGPLWYVLVYWDRWYEYDVINSVLLAANKLFNAIVEVQQGPCPANQLELTRGRFIESVNWLFDALLTAELSKTKKSERGNQYGTWSVRDENDEDDTTPDRQDNFLELQGLIVTTFNSMLEGNVVAAIPRRILAILNFSLIQQLMEMYLARFDEASDPDNPDLEDPYAIALINYYILTRNIVSRWESSGCTGQYSPSFIALLKSNVYQNCFSRFEGVVGSVELLREGRVEEVLFRVPGIVREQSQTPTFKESCNDLLYSVRRDNQPSKLDDFLSQSEELVYELTSFPRLKASWLVRRSVFFSNATFFLAVLLNILAMIPAFQNDGSDDSRLRQFTRPESLMIWLFGILQSIFACCRVVAYAAAHVPNFMFRYTKGNPNWFYETEGPFFWAITLWRFVAFGLAFFFSPFTFYQVLYVAFSVVAMDYHAFYAYHLFDLVGRSSQLREVFGSLGAYGSTLGVTALLWIILVYAFVVWGYLGFPDDFRNALGTGNMGVPGNNLSGSCFSPWECFIYHLSFALRQGGGIGDTLLPMGEYWNGDLGHFYYRAIYDLMFFIICVVVMTAIVTGIIIDAFGASRDHRKEVEENQNGICFICGIEGSRFETKRPKDKNDTRHYGFEWHLDHEHNQWFYVYFLAYLHLKDPNEYTGSESYVSKLVREKQTDFFPMDRALMLES